MVDEGGREITGEWEAVHLDTLAARRAHGQQQDNCLARMDATGEVRFPKGKHSGSNRFWNSQFTHVIVGLVLDFPKLFEHESSIVPER